MYLRRIKETAVAPTQALFFLQLLIVLFAFFVPAQAQRPGVRNPAREMVRAIERKEMDRMLLLKPIPAVKKDDPARRAVLKQISEDFRDLQSLNNRMMAQAWARQELDYRHVSDMVSQIRGKASRLKTNLAFPEVKAEDPKQPEVRFSDDQKFRAGLLYLDQRIMSFATNPLFQKPDVVEVELASKASRDLDAVIELSGRLKRDAGTLSKAVKASQ